MTPWGPIVIGFSYILGLLSTGIMFGQAHQPVASYGLLALSIMLSFWMPRQWRLGPTGRQWLLAGVISLVGAAYCLWRIPQPAADDVSQYAPGSYSAYGEIVSLPQINRSGKGKFWLDTPGIQNRA